MRLVDVELPRDWRRLEAVGCNYLACHTGAGGVVPGDDQDGESFQLTSDAVPVTVQGLDILSPPGGIRAGGLSPDQIPSSSIIAVEYPSRDVIRGLDGLYVVDVASTHIAGMAAERMDLTHRRSGVALFTRRWVMSLGDRTLEIAATCPLDDFSRHIHDFDSLEDRIHIAA